MCATNRDLLTIASRRQLTGPSPSAHRHGGGWQRGELEPHRAMLGIDQAASLCPIAVLPTAAKVLGVLVDGVPVGPFGPGQLGDRLPPAGAVGEHPQPLGFQHIGVVHPGLAGGLVGERRAGWLLAVAVAVALIAQILRVMAGPVAGQDGEVATQHRPAGGVLVDQIRAGGVGVAGEVAGDRVEQDATAFPQLKGSVAGTGFEPV